MTSAAFIIILNLQVNEPMMNGIDILIFGIHTTESVVNVSEESVEYSSEPSSWYISALEKDCLSGSGGVVCMIGLRLPSFDFHPKFDGISFFMHIAFLHS